MKSVQIGKLSNGQPLMLDVLRLMKSKLALLASSGGGKTWALFRILEATRGMIPHIILDPEGEFSVLRRRHNYVLAAAKGGDVLAHPSLAEALAKRCVEKKFNLIVDMYEMPELEQHRYVRIFLETLFDAPKKFWDPKLLVEDEAHEYAPETASGNSEALAINKRIAKKGRKRNIGAIWATQRPAEISKAVTSQCGNKLVGVAYQDVDRKRAASELEFTTKEEVASLRKLTPGTFYAYGPALGFDIKLATIDLPKDRPDEGGRRYTRPPAPSATLKAILSTLTELPKEAKEEARTIEELKAKVKDLERQLATASKTTHAMGAAVSTVADKELKKMKEDAMKRLNIINLTMDRRRIEAIQKGFLAIRADLNKALDESFAKQKGIKIEPARMERSEDHIVGYALEKSKPINKNPNSYHTVKIAPVVPSSLIPSEKKFGPADMAIAGFMLTRPEKEWTRAQISYGSGYSHNSSTFDNALSRLRTAGIISGSNPIRIDVAVAGEKFDQIPFPPTHGKTDWENNLGARAREFWNQLLANPDTRYTKEQLCAAVSCQVNSSTTDNGLSELNVLKAIIKDNGTIRLNPEMLEV